MNENFEVGGRNPQTPKIFGSCSSYHYNYANSKFNENQTKIVVKQDVIVITEGMKE